MACACSTEPRFALKLMQVHQHNEEVYSFDFESHDIESWDHGDSSKLYVTIDDQPQGKKFSYATLPEEGVIRFTTRIKEDHSAYKAAFKALKVGDWIDSTPPSGEFKLRREDRPILLLSNGVGIAAVRSLVKAFEVDPSDISELIQLNVDNTGAIYKEEFEEIALKEPKFKSKYTKSRRAFNGALDELLEGLLVEGQPKPLVYIVGSEAFVKDQIRYFDSIGFGEDEIVLDGKPGGCGCSSGGGCGCSSKLVSIL